jgi:adenosylcobinamide kinase/adenosylcobinamide-phosphate guanylyltransferase
MLTLILGGARSGKSRYAQELCGGAEQVVYVATARADTDEEMQMRIARHRANRPAAWTTVEEPLDVARAVREAHARATVLIDCVTVWVANLMWERRALAASECERLILDQAEHLIQAARGRKVIAVSNEVGSGIVPETAVGRAFRDVHGVVNQRLARAAAHVVLMVAGLPLTLKDER